MLQVEYNKDIGTEKWITEGHGKQVFFNLLVQVFSKTPKKPMNVQVYTNSKFDQHDSVMSFIKQFIQKVDYKKLNNIKKRAATVSIKNITLLYNQYVDFEKLGRPRLAKHLRESLKRYNYSVVKTRTALVIRGIILHVEKLKRIFHYKPNELAHWLDTNLTMSLETYERTFP